MNYVLPMHVFQSLHNLLHENMRPRFAKCLHLGEAIRESAALGQLAHDIVTAVILDEVYDIGDIWMLKLTE